MNWPAQSRMPGWTKSNRPIARAKRIASRFPADASRKNALLPPPNRPKRAPSPSRTSIFSGRTSVASHRPTRTVISSWPASFCSRRCKYHQARFTGFPAKILLKSPSKLPKRNLAASRRWIKTAAVLDLIFLGMGEDGHVASLFPDAPPEILSCASPFLAIENSPKPPPRRITLSYAAIAAARQVWALVSGAGKQAALRESLRPGGQTPLARVLQSRSRTTIFCDISA